MHQYMQECKTYENDPYEYSLFVHGYLIPWYEQQYKAGKIKNGKYHRVLFHTCIGTAKIGTGQHKLHYRGKIDEQSKPSGYGTGVIYPGGNNEGYYT